ncbi:uncharacterized protein LOC115632089 [Scaptodrosophila lebanonensis]|uniref:Uncharacterized protein LOC115632089 n=1 Tax=Drosophila lebanonensis TaxID=7225 RepID=A0A6J2UCT7_DROLE|nr:uncharacterized protein LOC115632089 [Scaptodrosophila lebanonensis]
MKGLQHTDTRMDTHTNTHSQSTIENYLNNNDISTTIYGFDAIGDSNSNGGDWRNNENYNNNKASTKWQQQKAYGNPRSIYTSASPRQKQQQNEHQQQQEQHQFVDDPEDARNDFRLRLSDLNEAVKGAGTAVVAGQPAGYDNANNNNNNKNNDNASQQQEQSLSFDKRRSQSNVQRVACTAPLQKLHIPNVSSDGVELKVAEDKNSYTLSGAREEKVQLIDGDVLIVNGHTNQVYPTQGGTLLTTYTAGPNGTYVNERGQPEYYDYDGIDVEGEEDYAVADNASFNDLPDDIDSEDADELSSQLPYGIQNVRKRLVRSVMPPPHHTGNAGNDGITYQSLCPTNRVTIKLERGQYRPNHYVEVTCAHNYVPQPIRANSNNNYEYKYRSNDLTLLRALWAEGSGEKREICSATGFSCIQLNRTIHLIRLDEGSGCWESETRTVPSGCECMWPKHSYGDIASYHQTQKRFGTLTRLRNGGDYKSGIGYRQQTLRARGQGGTPGNAARSRRDNVGYNDIYELN